MAPRQLPLLALMLLALAPALLAQETPPPDKPPELPPVTVQEANEDINRLKDSQGLSEEARSRLVSLHEQILTLVQRASAADGENGEPIRKAQSLLRKATNQLDLAEKYYRESTEAQRKREETPRNERAIELELERMETNLPRVPGRQASSEVWRDRLAQARAEQSSLRQQLDALREEKARLPKLAEKAAETEKRLTEINEQLEAPAPEDEADLLTEARMASLRATKTAVEAEVASYNQQRQTLLAATDLRNKKIDRLTTFIEEAQKRVDTLQEGYGGKEYEEEVARARGLIQKWKQTEPPLKNAIGRNAEFAGELPRIVKLIHSVQQARNYAMDTTQSLEAQYEKMQRREEEAGLTNSLGRLMRRRRPQMQDLLEDLSIAVWEQPPNLPAEQADEQQPTRNTANAPADEDLAEHPAPAAPAIWSIEQRRFSGARELRRFVSQQLDRLQAREMEVADARDSLPSREEFVERIVAGVPPEQAEALRRRAEDAYETRRALLDELIVKYNSAIEALTELDEARAKLAELVDDYQSYVDERVLWIQSTTPVTQRVVYRNAWSALQWLISPAGWLRVLKAIWSQLRTSLAAGLVAVLAIVLIALQPFLRRWMPRIGEKVSDLHSDRFSYTLMALGITVLIALCWPLLAWYVGWQLTVTLSYGEFVKAVGAGLVYMASLWFVLQLVRVMCMREGLVPVHFRLRGDGVGHVRRHLFWLQLVVLPCAFIQAAMAMQARDQYATSLGRFAFILSTLAFAVFMLVSFRPGGPLMVELLSRRRGGWLDRLRYVLHGLLVLLPLSLAVLSAAGWHYTADELYRRMWWTAALVLMTLLLGALLVRGLFVLRRRLALEEARRRAEEKAAAEKEAAEKGEAEADTPPTPPREEMDVSLYSITQETRRMIIGLLTFGLVIGLWFTWRDVLPAFGFLERVTLWTTTEVAADEAAGIPAQVNQITLANIGLALLIVVMTVIAARNIPGVLRITLLQRLPLDRGVRFAITSICRYLIGIIGGVIAFGAIGIGWAQVQWLVAAASLGLGFGLQEIFANFVSGLIILFERPMRVGDIVTVANVSGTVTRIRIRATTITDWDRKELIVPNREFITGQLINWSLSETTLRLSVEVGVAYGSDIEKVRRTLLRVASEHPAILQEPAPAVHFTEFAGSSLNFALRAFVPDFEKYWAVRNELHQAIDAAFREAKIEIPFQQQDLHIRSSSHELPVKIANAQPEQGPSAPEPDAKD